MPTSLMPKGVEHWTYSVTGSSSTVVPTSLMPKGVEHLKIGSTFPIYLLVPTSLMPKGVEHSGSGGCRSAGRCAHLSDAERR